MASSGWKNIRKTKTHSTHIGQARRRRFGRYVWATPPHLNHLTFLQELGRQAMARYRERKAMEGFVELGKFDPPLWHAPYGRIV